MTVTIVSPPSKEPVTLEEAKEHAGITGTSDNALIEALITAARQAVERYLDRSLITQTLKLAVDGFPYKPFWYGGVIQLPRPPLQSVGSVKYFDLDDTEQTLASSKYVVVTDREPGVVQLKHSQSWPTNVRLQNAVTVTYDAGYGDNEADVPAAIRRAVMVQVATMYNLRDRAGISSESIDNASTTYTGGLSDTVKMLLDPYRVWS